MIQLLEFDLSAQTQHLQQAEASHSNEIKMKVFVIIFKGKKKIISTVQTIRLLRVSFLKQSGISSG